MEIRDKDIQQATEGHTAPFSSKGGPYSPEAKEGRIEASEGPVEIMNLRDQFALELMKIFFSNPDLTHQRETYALCRGIYSIADAMMEARNGKKQTESIY